MTRDDKIRLLTRLFLKVSNSGVLTWGETENGYRWTCEGYGIAKQLADCLLGAVEDEKLDTAKFPYRFEPDRGATVIFEPVDD
ncbi:MAG: hypothetical protein IAG10_17370 [Planctomycetaceae bacterium]|nr:hypothetical protein [Planctomycetaceae bacterium]